jgi:GT2 family glycosyltransferase
MSPSGVGRRETSPKHLPSSNQQLTINPKTINNKKIVFLSVIIPTCNRNEMLGLCLERLAPGRQTLNMANYEVIVTDDSSGEGAETLCQQQYPWVNYTRGPRKGPAANRNNGAMFVKGGWLVFLDDDCVPDENLLLTYRDGILENTFRVEVFEGAVLPLGERTAFNQEAPININGGRLWSCNFCIKRSTFDTISGFNDSYPYAAMEDIDLKFKLEALSNDIVFLPSAKVLHPWKVIEKPFRKFEISYQSHIIFFRLWPKAFYQISITSLLKKFIYNWSLHVFPNIFKYKGKGLKYPVAYSYFLYRLMRLRIGNKIK